MVARLCRVVGSNLNGSTDLKNDQHYRVNLSLRKLSRESNFLHYNQCDQIVRLFFQYLAIQYNGNLPNSIKNFPT